MCHGKKNNSLFLKYLGEEVKYKKQSWETLNW
jgi:hypothetical protein